jgi:hypothetical protein
MFPLYEKELPKTAPDLARALTASLQRSLQIPGDPVLIREIKYPDLSEIAINLSGAQVRMNAPRPSLAVGEGEPAITARHFALKAEPLFFGDAAFNLNIDANEIVLHRSNDNAGNIFLQLQRANNGWLGLAVRQRDLEILVDRIAKIEAGKQGVAIDQVQLNLTSRGPRSLRAEVRVEARKLFLRTIVRIAGVLKIDEQLVAHISDLTCSGDGAIATLACGILTPHLQALQNRSFPLLALPLGGLQLRDINLNVIDGIEVTAEFGAVPV